MAFLKTHIKQKDKTDLSNTVRKNARTEKPQGELSDNPFRYLTPGSSLLDIPLSRQNMLYLQRTIGNQVVGRLLQAKLKIGKPGDKYEQEADRIADAVMSMPEPAIKRQPEEEEKEERIQTQPLATQITPFVQRQVEEEEEEEEEEPIQAKTISEQITPPVQRQTEEEEEEIQTKTISHPSISVVQKQVEEEEEETAQVKSISSELPILQKQEEEEEEEIQTKPVTNQTIPSAQKQAEEEEEETIQAKSSFPVHSIIQRQRELEHKKKTFQPKVLPQQSFHVKPNIENKIKSFNTGGHPLPKATRAFFEPRFGADFSNVRVHTNPQAGDTAKNINSHAFTMGQNIVFGAGQYAPNTATGNKLLAHELTHVVQQASDAIIRRVSNEVSNIERLRQLLKDDQENEAIKLMGRLSPREVETVLASHDFKELATDAFNDDEMYRGIRAMRGDLYLSLKWMFDEGTDWRKVRDVIIRAPSGKDRVRIDNWMKEEFVGICNDEEMAEAVELLGGTLLQQLTWMKAEGSNWSLVKARIQATTDTAQKLALYGNADMRDFFVDVCNDEEMAEAVGLLGGTLLQQLTWMKAEDSNWPLVKASIQATTDAAQKLALYGNIDIRDFFVDVCNDEEMAEAVGLLGGTLLQQLTWMKAEDSNWPLVKTRIQATTDAAQKLALYGNTDMRDFFVDVCHDAEIAEAVDLLKGTLLQKLRWMAAEGSNWDLVRKKIETTTIVTEKLDLYNHDDMRDFFVDICNNRTIIVATRLLGGTWAQKVAWMEAEGVTAPVAGEMKEMVGEEAKWVPSGPGSANTFESWASAATEGTAPPLKKTTTINCWEMILLAAYRCGVIDWNWIHNLYTAVLIADWVSKMASSTSPYISGTSTLSRGDLVFWNPSTLDHVALATGKKDEVYTFWPPPDKPSVSGTIDEVKISTIKKLSDYMTPIWGAPTVTFGTPAW